MAGRAGGGINRETLLSMDDWAHDWDHGIHRNPVGSNSWEAFEQRWPVADWQGATTEQKLEMARGMARDAAAYSHDIGHIVEGRVDEDRYLWLRLMGAPSDPNPDKGLLGQLDAKASTILRWAKYAAMVVGGAGGIAGLLGIVLEVRQLFGHN